MPIYDRPVRELLKQFVDDRRIVKGQTFPRAEIASWFRQNYPKIRPNTVNAQTILATTNNKTRVYYNADQRNDLFFQTDRGLLRLYDPENDPPPIYSREGANGSYAPASAGESEDPDPEEPREAGTDTEFAYEADLKNFLAANLVAIEPGLRLFSKIEGLSAVEFPVGGRYVDILATDADGSIVVIELKVSRGYDRVVGQLLRYMAWIEKNIAEPGQRVRGIIIARSISEDLILATSKVSDVDLFEYSLSVTVARVGNGQP